MSESPRDETIGEARMRMLYIGAVALLCRAHAAMGRERQDYFDSDGLPMERLAKDFNALGLSLQMERSATGWALFDAEVQP